MRRRPIRSGARLLAVAALACASLASHPSLAAGPCTVFSDPAGDQSRALGSDGRAIDLRSLQMTSKDNTLAVTLRVANLGSVGTTQMGDADYLVDWYVDTARYTAHASRVRNSWKFGVARDYPVRGSTPVPGTTDYDENAVTIEVPYQLGGITRTDIVLRRVTARATEHFPWNPERGPPVPLIAAGFDEGGGSGGRFGITDGC